MSARQRRIDLGGLCVVLAAIAACAAGGPGWVEDPYAGHGRERWVAGIGTGADRQSATADARAEVARILSAEVDGSLEARTSARSVTTGGQQRSSVVEQLVDRVTIRTDVGLRGSEIAETWRADDGTRYALAVLDKARMRESLAADIREREERIAGFLDEAKRAANPLERARAQLRALAPAEERNDLLGPYRAVGGRPRIDAALPSAAEIARQAQASLGAVRIQVDAKRLDLASGKPGGILTELRDDLGERLSRMGFDVARSAEAADALQLEARLGTEPFARGIPDMTTIRWRGSMVLHGGRPGERTIAISEASGDESHFDAATARTLALRKGAQALASDLEKRLSEFLYGTSES